MQLQELEVRVLEAWAERRAQYQEDLELQQLQRELEQAEHWLNTYESTLRAEDYGVMAVYGLLITVFFFMNFGNWENYKQHNTPINFLTVS